MSSEDKGVPLEDILKMWNTIMLQVKPVATFLMVHDQITLKQCGEVDNAIETIRMFLQTAHNADVQRMADEAAERAKMEEPLRKQMAEKKLAEAPVPPPAIDHEALKRASECAGAEPTVVKVDSTDNDPETYPAEKLEPREEPEAKEATTEESA